MTEVLPIKSQQLQLPTRDAAPQAQEPKPAGSALLAVPPQHGGVRSGHLNLDTFSPVNQDGSFAFDRTIKSGKVRKRTRKTKQWKSFHLVLRPNLLSLYKSPTEERLLKQLTLSELTAVAYLKDPKGRRQHLFGLYSPSRNWHLQAENAAEAKSWVELIKQEARIDEDVKDLGLKSPLGHDGPSEDAVLDKSEHERLGSSSPDLSIRQSTTRDGVKIPGIRRRSAPSLDYSGDDYGPYSDFSDTPPESMRVHTGHSIVGTFVSARAKKMSPVHHQSPYSASFAQGKVRPPEGQNASQVSDIHQDHRDEDKVIWHGHLLYLKNKGGVRQWKRFWVVLRPISLTFYKNDEEYSAHRVIALSDIINAVEIDPLSKSKKCCMQIITEDKSYRFCAPNEDALAEWLGALKSQLAKKREKEKLPK